MTKAELFSEYGSYHADRRNRACHAVGIPLIVFGLMGMLHVLRAGPIDAALVAALAVLVYYLRIDPRGALISTAVFAVLYIIASFVPWPIAAAAFIIGWAFQLIGHRFEGTKPKFMENLVYLLIGPLYFFEEVFDRVLGVHGESNQS